MLMPVQHWAQDKFPSGDNKVYWIELDWTQIEPNWIRLYPVKSESPKSRCFDVFRIGIIFLESEN